MAMPIKNIIKRLLLILSIPALVITYVVVNYIGKNNPLQAVKINIEGNSATPFVTQQGMMETLISNKNIVPKATSIKYINVHEMETIANNNPWVKSAEAYVNNSGVLQINIIQREPVLRLLTDNGLQYYLDDEGKIIPLHESCSADVPVVSSTDLGLNLEDQNIRKQAVALCSYISKDSFWNAMLTQVNINSNRDFELITAIAEHTILFGDTSNMADKFKRLYMYYKLAVPKVGYDAYAVLNVKNVGQIVGVKTLDEVTDNTVAITKPNEASTKVNAISKPVQTVSKPIAAKVAVQKVPTPIVKKVIKPSVNNIGVKVAVAKPTQTIVVAKPIVKQVAKPVTKTTTALVTKPTPLNKPVIKKSIVTQIAKPVTQKNTATQIAKPTQQKNTKTTKQVITKKTTQKENNN